MAKVFMVDDEPLLMESLEIILTYSGGHLISGSSNNGVEALEKLSGMSEEQLPEEVRLEEGRLLWEESDGVRVLRCAVAAEPGVPWLQHDLSTTIGDGIGDMADMYDWDDEAPEGEETAWD